MTLSPAQHRRSLLLATFASGFSAILYQCVWQRILGLFCGGDVVATSLIVTAFFIGLAIGGALLVPFVDKLSPARAVFWYGLTNIAIAIYGFGSKFLFYDFLYRKLGTYSLSTPLEYSLLVAALLPPTALMGASLPLLARTASLQLTDAPTWLSRLNGINVMGSVSGVLISAWVLSPYLGFESTLAVGAALNVTAALLAILTYRGWHGPAAKTKVSFEQTMSAELWRWGLVSFGSGFLAIGMEILWIRLLRLYSRPDAYLVADITAVILFGYALGNWYGASRFANRRHLLRDYSLALLAAVMWSLIAFSFVSYFYNYALIALRWDFARVVMMPLMLLLPSNFFFGLSFPVIQKAVQSDPQLVGGRVGILQTMNLAGNILGGAVTGLVLLHYLGTFETLRLFGIVSVTVAAWLVLPTWRDLSRWWTLALPLLVLLVFPSSHTLMARAHGVFWSDADFQSVEDRTGITATWKEGVYHLTVDADKQGHLPFGPTHGLLGALPVLVHPNPQRVLAIGLGSGGTPYQSGANPLTSQIDVYELVSSERPMLDRFLDGAHGAPLRSMFADKRYRVKLEDGRRALARATEGYDVIESDARYPERSFGGVLYSKEFFETVKAKLRPKGIFCMWLATPRTLNTLRSVFPHVVTLENEIALALASNDPITVDLASLRKKISEPRIATYLERGWLSGPYLIAALEGMKVTMWEGAPNTDINHDLYPKDEYLYRPKH